MSYCRPNAFLAKKNGAENIPPQLIKIRCFDRFLLLILASFSVS
jgi:hypothetical protein